MSRVALIGDIGGHSEELYSALVQAGADPDTGELPDDLHVVQVGDLVHRGPDSHGVLDIVAGYLEHQGDQWTQLIGNHEAMYLGGPTFEMPSYLDIPDQERVRSWWKNRQMIVACAVESEQHGPLLVAHAGLTVGVYGLIGEPETAALAAQLLNELPVTNPVVLWRAGSMLGDSEGGLASGPVWAEAGSELYGGWLLAEQHGLPQPGFGQVHGHSNAYWYDQRKFTCADQVAHRIIVNHKLRQTRGMFHNRPFFGIDASLGKYAGKSWGPLILENAHVVTV